MKSAQGSVLVATLILTLLLTVSAYLVAEQTLRAVRRNSTLATAIRTQIDSHRELPSYLDRFDNSHFAASHRRIEAIITPETEGAIYAVNGSHHGRLTFRPNWTTTQTASIVTCPNSPTSSYTNATNPFRSARQCRDLNNSIEESTIVEGNMETSRALRFTLKSSNLIRLTVLGSTTLLKGIEISGTGQIEIVSAGDLSISSLKTDPEARVELLLHSASGEAAISTDIPTNSLCENSARPVVAIRLEGVISRVVKGANSSLTSTAAGAPPQTGTSPPPATTPPATTPRVAAGPLGCLLTHPTPEWSRYRIIGESPSLASSH